MDGNHAHVKDELAVRRAPRGTQSRDHGLKWFTLTAAAMIAVGIALLGREFLPEKYYYDDSTIRDFLSGVESVDSKNAYGSTAALYRFMQLEDAPNTVAVLAVGAYIAAVWLAFRFARGREPGWAAIIVSSTSIILAGVYLAKYSKDFFVVPLIVLFIVTLPYRWGRIFWCAAALVYGYWVREYWMLVVAVYVMTSYLLPRMRRNRDLICYALALIAFLSIVFRYGLGVTPHYFRHVINDSLVTDRATMIIDPINSGNILFQILNIVIILVFLFVPLPLLLTGSVFHATTALAIALFWAVVFRNLLDRMRVGEFRNSWGSGVFTRCFSLIFAFTVTQAYFEPDYGSYLRHLVPLVPVALIMLLESHGSPMSSPNERIGHNERVA